MRWLIEVVHVNIGTIRALLSKATVTKYIALLSCPDRNVVREGRLPSRFCVDLLDAVPRLLNFQQSVAILCLFTRAARGTRLRPTPSVEMSEIEQTLRSPKLNLLGARAQMRLSYVETMIAKICEAFASMVLCAGSGNRRVRNIQEPFEQVSHGRSRPDV